MVIRIVQRCSLWRIETFLEWAGAWRRENTKIHKRKFIWKLQKSKTSKGSKFKYKESSKKWIICFFIWRLSECFGLFVWLGSKFITTDEDLRSNLFGFYPKKTGHLSQTGKSRPFWTLRVNFDFWWKLI